MYKHLHGAWYTYMLSLKTLTQGHDACTVHMNNLYGYGRWTYWFGFVFICFKKLEFP